MQILYKRYDFWTSYFWIVLPTFAMFFLRTLCLKDPLNCTCLEVKLLHYYLFRVEKIEKKNTCV